MFLGALMAMAMSTVQPGAPESATPANEVQPSPHQAKAQALLGLLASGNEAAIDAFVDAHLFAPSTPEMEPVGKTKARLKMLARQSGGVDVGEWHPQGQAIFFEGTTRNGAIPVDGALFFRDGRILGIDLQRNLMKRPADAPAWPLKAATTEEALAAIRAEVAWRSRAERFSGTVLIARRGEPVLIVSHGLSARGPDKPNRDDTLYHTASATKMLTSAAVATLIDRGKLTLETTVATAVAALAAKPGASTTTIADLLGHRVSYGEYFDDLKTRPELRTALAD